MRADETAPSLRAKIHTRSPDAARDAGLFRVPKALTPMLPTAPRSTSARHSSGEYRRKGTPMRSRDRDTNPVQCACTWTPTGRWHGALARTSGRQPAAPRLPLAIKDTICVRNMRATAGRAVGAIPSALDHRDRAPRSGRRRDSGQNELRRFAMGSPPTRGVRAVTHRRSRSSPAVRGAVHGRGRPGLAPIALDPIRRFRRQPALWAASWACSQVGSRLALRIIAFASSMDRSVRWADLPTQPTRM